MYAIHTTPGFIIDSRPYNEAGKIFSIFTRELGLVSAIAQGIRLEKSKLRYHAQEYSLAVFSLVRGKEFWRLTSATAGVVGANAGIKDLAASSRRQQVLPSNPKGNRGGLLSATDAEGSLVARIRGNDTQQLLARMALLLRRLLHGEEAHPELFDCIESCVSARCLLAELNDDQLKTLESITVLRMLRMLGYIGDDSLFDDELKSDALTLQLLNGMMGKRVVINQHINKALRESQL